MNAIVLFAFGDLIFDARLRVVTKKGDSLKLEPQEFKHLSDLALCALDGNEKKDMCAVYISKLRRKLAKAHSIVQIETIHGVGYRLVSVPTEFVPCSKVE